MKEYILPIGKPRVITHPDHAFFHSIFSLNKDYKMWLYSNFIQLYCNNFPPNNIRESIDLDFVSQYEYNNFIDIQLINRDIYEFFHTNISITNFFCKLIEMNLYLIIAVDEFYLSYSPAYRNNHFKHPLFLYGLNKDKGIFYASYYNSMGYVPNGIVKFTEIENAFKGFISLLGPCNSMLIRAISTKNSYYEINLNTIKKGLEEYIYPPQISLESAFVRPISPNKVYGINVYEALINYNNSILFSKNKDFIQHVKNYHALYEHKKLMFQRINYLIGNSMLKVDIEQFSDLVKSTLIIRNLYIKFTVSLKTENLKKINFLLLNLREDEKKILNKVLKEL